MPKAEIIYVFDGYCGWCWGMDSVISRLSENFRDRFSFSALSGGLMIGDRIGPLGNFAAYIEKAIPRVESLTGAVFSDAHRLLIKNPGTMQDSRVPAAAFATILTANSGIDTIGLAHEILALNFSTGADLSKPQSYRPLFSKYDLDASVFEDQLAAGSLYASAEAQFERARDMDASSFPAIVYGQAGQYFPLCEGYQPYEQLAHALETLHREPPEL